MNRGDTVKARGWDHKSKMRVIEHGEDWVVDSDPSKPRREGICTFILLKAVKDDYAKWWKTDFVNG